VKFRVPILASKKRLPPKWLSSSVTLNAPGTRAATPEDEELLPATASCMPKKTLLLKGEAENGAPTCGTIGPKSTEPTDDIAKP